MYPLFAAIMAGLFYIWSESFLRAFQGKSILLAVLVNILGWIFLLLLNLKKIPSLKIKRNDVIRLIVSGIIGFAGWYFFLYKWIDMIGGSKTAFLSQVEPIFIILLSIFFLKEKVKLKDVTSIILIMTGVYVLIGTQIVFSPWSIYAMLAGVMFAIWIVTISPVIKKYNNILITWLQMIIGWLSLSFLAKGWIENISIPQILIIIGLGIVIGLSRLFYNTGIKKIGAYKTSVIYTSKSFIIFTISLLVVTAYPLMKLKIPENIYTFIFGGILMCLWIILLNIKRIKLEWEEVMEEIKKKETPNSFSSLKQQHEKRNA